MRVFIVEDEAPAVRRLKGLLHEVDSSIEVVAQAESVAEAAVWLRSHAAPDLMLLDVQLADGLCFEIFRHVRVQCPVIFTTAYDEYALQAFMVHSIDYLLKPIEREALGRSIAKLNELRAVLAPSKATADLDALLASLAERQSRFRTRFLVECRESLVMVPVSDVAYIYCENRLVRLVTRDSRSYCVEATLEAVAAELDPAVFFRANRQFIVSSGGIAQIQKHFGGKLRLVLSPPAELEVVVSRDRAAELRRWLDR